MSGHFHRLLGASIVTVATCTMPTVAYAQQTYSFDQPAQRLSDALRAIGAKSGISIAFDPAIARGKNAPAIKGVMSVREALDRVLAASGLRINEAPNGGFIIVLMPRQTAVQDQPLSFGKADGSVDEEIVVTGTNIRGGSLNAPAIILTRDEMRRSGFTSVDQALATVPQNFVDLSAGVAGAGATVNISNVGNGNFDRASGVNLRGLGADSTLTLVNGARRAGSANGRVVDISSIPLSVVERIDVVTDGRSAVYGSDAVGGVVNIRTRHSFDGAETDVAASTYGFGGERLQLSQTFGVQFDRGGFVVAYDFTRDWPADLVDADLVSEPTPTGADPTVLEMTGSNRRHSGYLGGEYKVGSIKFFIDGLYSHQDSSTLNAAQFPGAPTEKFQRDSLRGEQYSFSGGARIDLGADWQATATGLYSAVDNDIVAVLHQDDSIFPYDDVLSQNRSSSITSGTLLLEGPLFRSETFEPRLAVGAEIRQERFSNNGRDVYTPLGSEAFITETDFSSRRAVKSAFAELALPLRLERPFLYSLEFSVAARYDDYSDFGDTFNPQFGAMWMPSRSLAVKANFSRAYRAPALIELQPITIGGILPIPAPEGGRRPVLFILGNDRDLAAEKAKAWNVGLDFTPEWLGRTKISLSYFNIDYRNRIDAVGAGERFSVLTAPQRFGELLNISPTQADITAYVSQFDSIPGNASGIPWTPDPTAPDLGLAAAFPNLALFEGRTTNISVEHVEGIDLSIQSSFDLDGSRFNLGANATYTPKHDRSLTPTTPKFSRINEPGFPSDFRFRLTADWQRGAFGLFGGLNYVDGYENPFSIPTRIRSAATIDLAARFDGDAAAGFPIKGLSAVLSVQNLLDSRPPRFADPFTGVLFDATNALSVGRNIALRVTKRW